MTGILMRRVSGLARSCHPGPTLAVTLLAALLALAFDSPWPLTAIVVVAVLTGQLVIGWSNDLIDADRDRSDERSDKPLAGGSITKAHVRAAVAASLVLCVLASLALGWRAGLIHLVLLVGSGVAYNAGLKATKWSFVPYALAFGSLPAVVWIAVVTSNRAGAAAIQGSPPVWMLVVGALLGVGAHLLNVLPDLIDDERHGIRGLPHRLGQRRTQLLAPLLLGAGTVITVLAPGDAVRWWGWLILGATALLAVVAGRGSGRTPFRAAVGLALLSATALLAGSWS